MTESGDATRRLAAILMADVVGYSRLMGQDDEATVAQLKAFRRTFDDHIRKHRGRLVNAPGDSILAEFASVVDAVQCAVEVQREFAQRNAELPSDRRMQFRIGVNLGDIVADDQAIYGDGVNIAARLEALAEPGGIVISGKAQGEVKGRVGLEFEFMGRQQVKNIADPVPAFRVLSEGIAAAPAAGKGIRGAMGSWKVGLAAAVAGVIVVAGAVAWYLLPGQPPTESTQEAALPLPDKPSIAVLPFVNMSGDREQEYFADGMTETLITSLSKLSNLFVISRNSVFTYKGQPVDVRRVSRELGVRYVLEGSVQKAGNRVRITAQLIDAVGGDHLWAEQFDRDLQDIFAIQDEITRKIVTELDVKLIRGEEARVWRNSTENVEAYEYFMKGWEHFQSFTRDDHALARPYFLKAVDLDPGYALAYAYLGVIYLVQAIFGWSDNPDADMERAVELEHKALALDDSVAFAHAVLGRIELRKGRHDRAIASGRRAVELDPNGGAVNGLLGWSLVQSGRPEEGVVKLEKAARLAPLRSARQNLIWWGLADAYWQLGRHEESIEVSRDYLEYEPEILFTRIRLVTACVADGRHDEARAEATELLARHPDFSVDAFAGQWGRKAFPYEDPVQFNRIVDSLRQAGLK
ncbi:MAG: tetratricopeptide repeat protein [SAR324 cluster bacterium]|nr:tetratricopeptide repeat protein [SAR324 cluster bacterium]